MSEYTLAQARQEVAALNENVIAHLNRIGALEAVVRELLHHMPTEVVESMARTYDVQMTMAMEKLGPPLQREQLWSHFLSTMEDIATTRRPRDQPGAHQER